MTTYKPDKTKLVLQSTEDDLQVELSAQSKEKRLQNEITSFPEPDQQGGNVERRAQNLNLIEEVQVVNAIYDGEWVEGSDDGHSTSKQVEDELDALFKANSLLQLDYGDETYIGFLTELSEEKSAQNSMHGLRDVRFNFLVAVKMSG